MKILFLEVEGPVNTPRSLRLAAEKSRYPPGNPRHLTVDKACVRHLCTIVEATGCRLVFLSDVWRRAGMLYLENALRWGIYGHSPSPGWKWPILGFTAPEDTRTEEISAWLMDFGETDNHVIVDKVGSDILHKSRLVEVSDVGLRQPEVEEIVRRLNASQDGPE